MSILIRYSKSIFFHDYISNLMKLMGYYKYEKIFYLAIKIDFVNFLISFLNHRNPMAIFI